MSDYTFMKTGLLDVSNPRSAFQDEIVTKILGVITVMLQKAVETAGVFAEHGIYHREINSDDIRRAMKVQAQTFFKSSDLESRVSSVIMDIDRDQREVIKTIQLRKIKPQRRRRLPRPSPAEEEEEENTDFDLPDFSNDPDPDPKLPYNTCECKTCTEIRTLVDGWDAWDPEDEVERFLKKHIDAM